MKLFVYGTLKRGWGNHRLLEGATFLREDSITGDLYESGIPFAVPGTGTVHGELFEVPEALIPRLDSLEGHPGWYKRTVQPLHGGGEASVYIYQHHPPGKQIESGRF